LLEVRALGTGRVLLNGHEINEWDGVLPRSLFFYLIDKGMTRRDDIFATFWPNLSVREATNVFHVTKRKISEVLGVDLTNYWGGFYRISNDIELSYDVVQFSEMVQGSALAPIEVESELLRSAVWLYRDHFLTSVEMPWVADRRYELLQTYGEALIGLAKSLEKRDARYEALGYYLRASATTPRREDIALNTMQLYRDLGMPEDALKVYERLKDELARTVNVSPNKNVQELAEEIRRDFSGIR
jgi:two-component SAPR family response regulator